MSTVTYSVTATFASPETCDRYIEWLMGGHCRAVIEGGALRADIARLDFDPTSAGTPAGHRVQVRYVFASRRTLDRYVREVAPALRAEGVALWGTLATFERTVGDVVGTIE
jgi:hypothetical protein